MKNNTVTPFGRLQAGYCFGFGPLLGSFLVAQTMLLAFKIQELSPEN